MSTIQITIDPVGATTVEGQGFTDGSCKTATAPFEAALGGDKDVTDKPEAHVPPAAQQQQQHNTW